MELGRLSLDELNFVSISFSERRLKRIQAGFKACHVQRFMQLHGIACLKRPEITTRLENVMAKTRGGRFTEIYGMVRASSDTGTTVPKPQPDRPAFTEKPAPFCRTVPGGDDADPGIGRPSPSSRETVWQSDGGLQFPGVDLEMDVAYSTPTEAHLGDSETFIDGSGLPWNGKDWLTAE